MITAKYIVTYPATPGATPSTQSTHTNLRDARTAANRGASHRRDLNGQDVRIERPNGRLVEYAGPPR